MTISFDTVVAQFQNGSQQRMARRKGLVKFESTYSQLTRTQKDSVKSGFTSAKGQFDGTQAVSLPFGGSLATFSNFAFDSDEIIATESRTTIYDVPVKLSQVIGQSLSPGTAGTAFPALANGAKGVLPFVQKKRFQTVATVMAAGPKYTYAEFAGGLVASYPADGLLSWEWNSSKLSDADIVTLTAHFIANSGRLHPFTFTDPEDGTPYATTHYDSDEWVITYNGVNDASVKISLEATF